MLHYLKVLQKLKHIWFKCSGLFVKKLKLPSSHTLCTQILKMLYYSYGRKLERRGDTNQGRAVKKRSGTDYKHKHELHHRLISSFRSHSIAFGVVCKVLEYFIKFAVWPHAYDVRDKLIVWASLELLLDPICASGVHIFRVLSRFS